LFELLRESGRFAIHGLDKDKAKMRELGQSIESLPERVDIMHICIPCVSQDQFVNAAVGYVKQFKPRLAIVDSTVIPGTTMDVYRRCSCLVVHSPIRGVHKSLEHMKWEVKRWKKYVGGASSGAGKAAHEHFEKLGLKTKVLKSCTETELAKLFETTYRAWMIVCFQEMHRVSRHSKADFDGVVDFLEDTHIVRLDRPIMFPGVIGGHCLIPNTELLLGSYDSEFLRLILKSNEKRKKEIKDRSVYEEAEKVSERARTLQEKLMKTWEVDDHNMPC
jgi:UDP-N-acetyl-D-mannosaminuronate dehydrogenase